MRTLLALLVRLYPAAFREQFGEDMAHQLDADWRAARERGRASAAAFAIPAALELLGSAAAEWIRPSWVAARPATDQGRGGGWTMDGLKDDLRHAVRSLGRARGFTLVTVGTLGLAIGANAGIFSVIDTVLLDPLPFAENDRLVHVALSAPGSDFPEEFGVSNEFYVQYAEEAELLEDVALFVSFTQTLRVDDRAERVRQSVATPSLFTTLGATPLLGRLPVPEDEDGVVVLSHALWTTWFGADPSVVGRSLEVLGATRTVVAVMGPGFWFPSEETTLWVPWVVRPEEIEPGRFGSGLIARTAPAASHEAVVDELTRLGRLLPERFGGSASYARLMEQHRPLVRPLQERLLGFVAGPLWLLFGAVVVVLLIACANVANLFVVRSERRQQDLAVRRAIGAARSRLVRLQMAEAVVVAGLAAVVALAVARLGVPLLLRAAPQGIPRVAAVGTSAATVLFALGLALLAAVLCGLVPAVRASSPGLGALREGGRGSTRGGHRGRDALVVAQTALALVLLIGSGLLVRSFVAVRAVDPGYDIEDVFTFQIAPEGDDLRDAPSFARFHLDFMDRLRALPGVESVGVVENLPLNESVASVRVLTEETAADSDGGALVGMTFAAGDYFRAMGIGVLQGRVFTDDDHGAQPGHVIVSRSAAELLWPGQDPVGQLLRNRDLESWETVVGVVEDVQQYDFRQAPQPMVYFPLVGQDPASWVISTPAYVMKSTRADLVAPEVRALVREVAPGAPMYRVFTMEGLAAQSMDRLSFTMLMLGLASALALALGSVGLYGVLSYVVAERTREIGVRMALGAEASRVQGMVVAQGARVVVMGVVVGVAAALAATRLLGSLLFGVEALDATTFLGMSALMVLVGLLASWLPARRASLVDPIQSLRA